MEKIKYKIFQDATQGYIQIEDIYVNHLIDTLYVQREKNVSQVGIRSVFSGATHDRFSHSLGVYGMGKRIFTSFKDSLKPLMEKNIIKNHKNELEEKIKLYEVLYTIACLLHDIGHPALSHTLEYLYNDDYMNMGVDIKFDNKKRFIVADGKIESGCDVKECVSMGEKEVERIIKRYIWSKEEGGKKTFLKEAFIFALKKAEGGHNNGLVINSSPHETMGAFQVLKVSRIKKSIEVILEKKLKVKGQENLEDHCAFIARMITGTKYDIRSIIINKKEDAVSLKLEYSLRNCIISLLNGLIDADSIDYLNRNAHFSGYATNSLDVMRLCNAFQAYFDESKSIFTVCIAKSALSSLEDFVQARNFEPKWLYSHHKIVYFNEVLIEYLIKLSSVYLFKFNQKEIEELVLKALFGKKRLYKCFNELNITDVIDWEKLFCRFSKNSIECSERKYISEKKRFTRRVKKNIATKDLDGIKPLCFKIEESAEKPIYFKYNFLYFATFVLQQMNKVLDNKSLNFQQILETSNTIHSFLDVLNDFVKRLDYIYINYILSPNIATSFSKNGKFFKATDCSVDSLFNYLFLSVRDINSLNKKADFRHEMFLDLLEEFKTRKYRKSLWKTYDEYKLFIKSMATKTGLSVDIINKEFVELIKSVSGTECCIEFEDKVSASNDKELNCIYVNCYEEESVSRLKKLNNKKEAFRSVFECLGTKMIIRLHKCQFKNFNNLEILFGEHKVNYGDISEYKTPKTYVFPYIYYSENTQEQQVGNEKILIALKDKFLRYLSEKIDNNSLSYKGEDMRSMPFEKGKIIRDSVHGDIFVEQKYLNIINTAAFQRLHRIKQLATADMIFPEAVHTRFAHSIGTFYIMKQIMNHFCVILDELKIAYTQEDKDVVLVAALLHDIGHGPFSHALEGVIDIGGNKLKKHEEWSIEIILNDKELNDVLKENFSINFAEKVSECLKNCSCNSNTLTKVFHELISSNLDADRLDYLLRDSYNTGEKIGLYDLQKLISSMELTEYNGHIRVAIKDSALEYVNQYVLARYHMYSSVYFAPFKLATEELFRRLIKIIVAYPGKQEFSTNEKIVEAKEKIQNLKLYKIYNNSITVKDYLSLDDYSIMNEVNSGLTTIFEAENKPVYKMLAKSFLYSNNHFKLKKIGNGARSYFDKAKIDLKNKFPYFNELNSVIELCGTYSAYTKNLDNEILIILSNGEIKPYSKLSKFSTNFNDNKLFFSQYNYYYFNKLICDEELKDITKARKGDGERIDKLFDSYDIRKHTEIENKYHCEKDVLQNIINTVKENYIFGEYEITSLGKTTTQEDVYFDTNKFVLAKNNYALRVRKINNNYILTIKKPGTIGVEPSETQFVRLEFETTCPECGIQNEEAKKFINDNDLIQELINKKENFKLCDLQKVIKVSNRRKNYSVKDRETQRKLFEISLDEVKYEDVENKNTIEVCQVEIELKESYNYRISLNQFASKFCEKFNIAIVDNKPKLSKYLEALTFFGKL